MSRTKKGCGIGAEYPYSHSIQLLFIILFTSSWFIDAIFLKTSIQFGNLIIDIFRLTLFLLFLILAFLCIKSSGFIISEEIINQRRVVEQGIYSRVRHPMYLGILLIYVAFIFLTLSFICLIIFIFIIIIMNKMADYEENALEKIFENEYRTYVKKTPKWIPKLKRN